jgi:hypothetical protein
MDRYDSPAPISIPEPPFYRADLAFHEVDHSGLSYEGRIYLNNREAGAETPPELESGYAGSFYVFGSWGCLGDEGHCDVPSARLHAFDRRPPHKLTPYKLVVEITEALTRLAGDPGTREFAVSVVPIPEPLLDDDDTSDVLHFTRLSLLTYEE